MCWEKKPPQRGRGESALSPEGGVRGGQQNHIKNHPQSPNLQPAQSPFAQRAAICPTGAMHWIGERRTAGDVIKEVLRDRLFYEEGGGVTLTGGEPTMQPNMAEALLRLAKAEGISTAMETCGHTQWAVWERLYPYLDDILFDVKHIDNKTHLTFTGISNQLILSNLRRLVALNAPVTVRVPLIPGFNASVESIEAIAGFVRGLGGPVKSIDLLPYHTLGKSKYTALGKDYPWEGHACLTNAEVGRLAGVRGQGDVEQLESRLQPVIQAWDRLKP